MDIETNPYTVDDNTINTQSSMSTEDAMEKDIRVESKDQELPSTISPKRVTWGDKQNPMI